MTATLATPPGQEWQPGDTLPAFSGEDFSLMDHGAHWHDFVDVFSDHSCDGESPYGDVIEYERPSGSTCDATWNRAHTVLLDFYGEPILQDRITALTGNPLPWLTGSVKA